MSIALITGGSRGLGKSMALQLAEKGVDVIITYRERALEADAVVQEIRKMGRIAEALALDLNSSKSFSVFAVAIKGLLESRWQRADFDFLVNNAGAAGNGTIMDTAEEVLDELYRVHFKATFLLSQALLPSLKDGGRILNISSGLARMTLPGYSAYASMKAAVETLTRYMAKELGSRNITVNVIAPGPIETDFGGGRVRDNADLNRLLSSQTALGRVGQADDIGHVVANFLVGETQWITAQRIEVSGGCFL